MGVLRPRPDNRGAFGWLRTALIAPVHQKERLDPRVGLVDGACEAEIVDKRLQNGERIPLDIGAIAEVADSRDGAFLRYRHLRDLRISRARKLLVRPICGGPLGPLDPKPSRWEGAQDPAVL